MLREKYLASLRSDELMVLKSFWKLFTALLALVTCGTLGYMVIEGWPFLDSLYMTVITVSTVGFKEVRPTDPAGQAFTIMLIMLGIAVVTYSAARLGAYVVEGELHNVFENRRRRKMIEDLRGHHIVCGSGRVGGEVARQLHRSGVEVVVVDQSVDELRDEVKELDLPFVLGNATERTSLEEANIRHAANLFTCLPHDADNVYICLIAKSMQPDINIIARLNALDAEDLLLKAGANRVVAPYTLSADRMAMLCLRPAVTRFMDAVSSDFRFEEISIPENSSVAGKELKDSGIRQHSDAIVVAILKADGNMQPSPKFNALLSAGDTLILLGSGDQLEKAQQLVTSG